MSALREAAKEILRIWGTGDAGDCETTQVALQRLHEAVQKPPDIVDLEFDPRSKFALCGTGDETIEGFAQHGVKAILLQREGSQILRVEASPPRTEGEIE